MRFADIIGHTDVINHLRATVHMQRISHSQLFAGKEGIGKLALALAYAQYISCTDRTPTDSCGKCASCNKFQKLIHPDLHFVFPVVKKGNLLPVSDSFISEWRQLLLQNYSFGFNKWLEVMGAENSQATIYTNESQEIIKKLSLKSFEAEYKIMIIYLPEKMNTVTANKLLKMIEEPPHKTLFLMVSVEADQVLGTILSRTQIVKIPQLDDQTIADKLQANWQLDTKLALSLAHSANGSYLKAVELLHATEDNKRNFEWFTRLMRLAYMALKDNSKIGDLMSWADEMAGIGREKQKNFLNYALYMLRENLVLNVAAAQGSEIVYLGPDELNFSKKFSEFINPKNIVGLDTELNKAFNDIERNGSARIVFLDMALRITRLIHIKTVKQT